MRHNKINDNYTIAADSFDLDNRYGGIHPTNDISHKIGSIPNFWTNSAPYSRWDLNPANNVTLYRRNPTTATSTLKYIKNFSDFVNS